MAIQTTMTQPPDTHVYFQAVVVPLFSALIAILILPALIQHYRNRNIGATALVAALLVALFNSFINAIIWPNDDMSTWFNGEGLCDIEVKIMVLQNVLFPASVCCILRALAAVMNTDSQTWIQTTAQKRRACVIDLLCCVAAPSLQMLFHFICQPNRYYVIGIAGCGPSVDLTWLAVVLLYLPPVFWTIADVVYAILIMIRLVRYRSAFNAILANNNTTKSRFLRLYILCCMTTLGLLPTQILTLYFNLSHGVRPYKWSTTHPDGSWNQVIFVRSDGGVPIDRIIWLCGGAVVFFLFGFGRDATKMYKEFCVKIGLGRLFPSLRPEYSRRGSIAATISTIGSKARLWLKRKDTNATYTNSTMSMTDSMTSPISKKMTFEESIRDSHGGRGFRGTTSRKNTTNNLFSNWSSIFQKKTRSTTPYDDSFLSTQVNGTNTIQSTVTAGPLSPITARHIHSKKDSSGEVLVMKEIRQASETAETLPAKLYEGV